MSESSQFHPIDAAVLDWQALCDRCMGNLDLIARVLDKFEQRLPGELAELERVLELGDAAMIALVAHRIKGNSSNISAAGLQKTAAEIEDLSRAGRVADIPARLLDLRKSGSGTSIAAPRSGHRPPGIVPRRASARRRPGHPEN